MENIVNITSFAGNEKKSRRKQLFVLPHSKSETTPPAPRGINTALVTEPTISWGSSAASAISPSSRGGRPYAASPPRWRTPPSSSHPYSSHAAAGWVSKISNFYKIFGGLVLGCIKTKFAIKYAFDSIFQALQDVHTFAPLPTRNLSKRSV